MLNWNWYHLVQIHMHWYPALSNIRLMSQWDATTFQTTVQMLLTKQTVNVHTKTKFLCSPRVLHSHRSLEFVPIKYMQYSEYHTYSVHGWLPNNILLQNISYNSARNKAVQITQDFVLCLVGWVLIFVCLGWVGFWCFVCVCLLVRFVFSRQK